MIIKEMFGSFENFLWYWLILLFVDVFISVFCVVIVCVFDEDFKMLFCLSVDLK